MSDLNLWKYPNSRGGAVNLWKYPNSRGGAGNIVASVGERLGWQECEEPYCGSFDRQGSHAAGEYVAYECGNCVDGWTPPAELVERIAELLWTTGRHMVAKRMLLEQARWIGEQDG